MAMPTNVPIIDTMIGFPMRDVAQTYAFITRQTKDAESKNEFSFPAHVGGLTHLAGAQGHVIKITQPESARRGDGGVLIIEVALLRDEGGGSGTIEKSCV